MKAPDITGEGTVTDLLKVLRSLSSWISGIFGMSEMHDAGSDVECYAVSAADELQFQNLSGIYIISAVFSVPGDKGHIGVLTVVFDIDDSGSDHFHQRETLA